MHYLLFISKIKLSNQEELAGYANLPAHLWINQSILIVSLNISLTAQKVFTPTLQKSYMQIHAGKNHYYLSKKEAVSHILFTAEDQNPELFSL